MSRLRLPGAVLFALSIAGFGAFATACVAPDAATEEEGTDEAEIVRRTNQVQMNDVSILYPLAHTKAQMAGYLSASDEGRGGGALLPSKLYTDATGEPATEPSGSAPVGSDPGLYYDELKVVAFRIDPCFANIGPVTDPDGCKNQLRLIFQPLTFASGSASATDGAVHAFYSLTRDELVDLVKEVVALRQSETTRKNLGALAVHPVLASQGLLGREAKGLRAIVLKYAGSKNLVQFTKFSPGNLATRWDFAGFDVKNGKATPSAIPTLKNHAKSVSFFAGFGADLAGGFNPPTTADDDMQLLGNFATARAASKKAQQDAFDAALRIENPDDNSPETIDCASCHVAGPSSVLTGGKLGLSAAGNPNAFARNKKFVSAAEMRQTTSVNAGNNRNFHMFSYRNSSPMISLRVINETATVVTYLNGDVFE